MAYMGSSEKAKGKKAPPKMPNRSSLVAENPLEIRQVYKLLQLARQRNKEQMEKLVHLGFPDLINLTEPGEGINALHLASVDNDLEFASFLVSLNAHPDVQDKKGRTAMMLAADLGHVDMVDFLLNNHASLSLVDVEGKGLLFYCIGPTERHKQIMTMVLEMDVDVNNVSHAGKSIFMFACEHTETCEKLCVQLLERGANPDVADPVTGFTALMAVVAAGSVSLVREIMQKGVDPNKVDKNGLSAVHIAAAKGYFEMLRIFSAYSADFNISTELGNTALHEAAAEGQAECCRFLFQRGCDMTKNKQNLLPSQVAKNNGHKAALRELKEAEQILKNETVAFNEARLHDWSFEHEAVLRQAIKSAAAAEPSVEVVPNETLVSVLQTHHAPISEESLEVVIKALDKSRLGKLSVEDFFTGNLFLPNKFRLLSYKPAKPKPAESEPSMPPLTEKTPTSPGRPEPHAERIRISRDRPRSVVTEDPLLNLKPKEIYINLSQCVRREDYELLKLAFSQNVPVDTRDRMYKTPLMTACMNGKYQMAQFLISHGADVNCHDQFRWTALHHACLEGHVDIVKLLVDHGAMINGTTTNGVTPLMRAIQSCKSNCVDLLLNLGANVEATNKQGQDCMTIAQLCGTVEIRHMVEIWLERARSQASGKKAAPPKPKPASTTPKKGTCLIALNPDVTEFLITLPSTTVQGVPVVSSPQLEQRLEERKKLLAKEDTMKLSAQKPVKKTKGSKKK